MAVQFTPISPFGLFQANGPLGFFPNNFAANAGDLPNVLWVSSLQTPLLNSYTPTFPPLVSNIFGGAAAPLGSAFRPAPLGATGSTGISLSSAAGLSSATGIQGNAATLQSLSSALAGNGLTGTTPVALSGLNGVNPASLQGIPSAVTGINGLTGVMANPLAGVNMAGSQVAASALAGDMGQSNLLSSLGNMANLGGLSSISSMSGISSTQVSSGLIPVGQMAPVRALPGGLSLVG